MSMKSLLIYLQIHSHGTSCGRIKWHCSARQTRCCYGEPTSADPPLQLIGYLLRWHASGEDGGGGEGVTARPPRLWMWIVIKSQVAFHSTTDDTGLINTIQIDRKLARKKRSFYCRSLAVQCTTKSLRSRNLRCCCCHARSVRRLSAEIGVINVYLSDRPWLTLKWSEAVWDRSYTFTV